MVDNFQSFGTKVRSLRESKKLLLRQLAASMEVDPAFLSKLERSEKIASRDQVVKLASLLNVPESDILPLWLSERIISMLKDDPFSKEALQLTLNWLNRK